MLDHISISVANIEISTSFYLRTLSELGYTQLLKDKLTTSFGTNSIIRFVISQLGNIVEPIGKARGFHIAFKAPSQAAVLAWYNIALENNAKSIVVPQSIKSAIKPDIFHALVEDPDGWRLEAIYRKEEAT